MSGAFVCLELTGFGDKKIAVNANHIICVKQCENRDMHGEIDLTDGKHLLVKETYTEILQTLSQLTDAVDL